MENIYNDMCTRYGQFYFPVIFKVSLGYTYYNSKTEDSFQNLKKQFLTKKDFHLNLK